MFVVKTKSFTLQTKCFSKAWAHFCFLMDAGDMPKMYLADALMDECLVMSEEGITGTVML